MSKTKSAKDELISYLLSLTPEQATEILRKYAPYKNDKDNLNKPKEWAE